MVCELPRCYTYNHGLLTATCARSQIPSFRPDWAVFGKFSSLCGTAVELYNLLCVAQNGSPLSKRLFESCRLGKRQGSAHSRAFDDLHKSWAKQVVLTVVAQLAHGSPRQRNLAVEGIMKRPNPEAQNARKPTRTPGFLAKSVTCSRQIQPISQPLPNSSRATS
jgi:hypothetical protein